MAQWWKNNALLIDGHGNFGSVYGDSSAASRYCCTGDTLVNILGLGSISIEKFIQYKDITSQNGYYNFDKSIMVKGPYGKWVQSDCIIDSGVHDIYELKLRNGMSLKGTPNHPVLCCLYDRDHQLFYLDWKRLDAIKPDDAVVIDSTNPNLDYDLNSQTMNSDDDLESKFLGCMISEGCITTQDRAMIVNSDMDLIKPVIEYIQCKYNTQGSLHRRPLDACYEYVTTNKQVYNDLIIKYEYGRYSNERCIPGFVFNKNMRYKAQLLRYLFEGDGSVKYSISKREERYPTVAVSYDSNSRKLIQQVQLLLLEFGVESNILKDNRERKQGYGYKLYIVNRFNLERFYKYIGFVSKRKQDVLSKYVEMNTEVTKGSNYTIQSWMNVFKRNNAITTSISTERSFNNYKEYLEEFYSFDTRVQWLKNFYKNMKGCRVLSCNKLDTQERVYSFRINTEDHAYITNGIVSHNTECRLTKYAEEVMLADLSKDVVDFVDNYDNTLQEPTILPCKLPNLLINGGEGTGLGFSCCFLPHNPREVIELLIAYVGNRNMDWRQAVKYIKGPDFPTGGIINGMDSSLSMYYSGIGSVKCRGKVEFEETKNGYTNIVITEVPYGIQINNLLAKITQLYELGQLNIRFCHDESSKEGVRIVVQLKKDEDPERVVNLLYKRTQLETSYAVAQYAVDYDGKGGLIPKLSNLMTIVQKFVTFRENCIHRKLLAELGKKNERLHILAGLFIVNKDIDKCISLIRNSDGGQDTISKLMKYFKLSEPQAKYIVDMKLGRLSRLDMNLSKNEEKKLKEEVKVLQRQTRSVSNNDIDEYMINEWKEIRDTIFKKATRKTQIIREMEKIDIDDTVRDIPCSIIITKKGYIKRTPLMSNVQNRAGLGITLGLGVDDEIMQIIHTSTTTPIYAVTSTGRAFLFKPYTLDETNKNSRGKYIRTLFHLKDNERIIRFINHEPNKNGLLIATQKGLVKITDLEELSNINSNGKRIFGLDKKDAVADIALVNTESDILIVTADGMGLRTKLSNIRVSGTSAMGVNGISVKEGDYVTGVAEIDNKSDIVFISENAFIKRCEEQEFNTQNRGGYGVIVSPKTEEYGSMVAVSTANKTVTICTREGKLLTLDLNTVRKVSRKSKGVKAVTLVGTDKVIGIC